MDSDDDFMSDVSSQDDFLDMQGSDDESLGEGVYQYDSRPVFPVPFSLSLGVRMTEMLSLYHPD